jgi:glycosyltransferase involved in cell wall biosynthesis
MRILVTVHHFPPNYVGGAELRAYRTAKALIERGYEVRIICIERIDSGEKSGVVWEDDNFDGIPVQRLFFNHNLIPDPFRWSYNNPWIGEHLQEFVQDFRPDILHMFGGYLMTASPLLIADQLGISTVVTLTDFWFLCPRIILLRTNGQVCPLSSRPLYCARCLAEEKRRYRIPAKIFPGMLSLFWKLQRSKINRHIERRSFLTGVLNNVGAIISPSKFLAKTFIKAGIKSQKIIYSRQGRDFPALTPEVIIKKPSNNHLRVGYLGQIAELKGVHILFEAIRKNPSMPYLVKVYGDLSRFPKYVELLKNIISGDSRILLLGTYKSPEEMHAIYQELDVLVVPSLWYENSPNVILESFAHLTPVIASDLGGMAELVQHGVNGLLFKPGDVDDLACQLERLVSEPDLLLTLRKGITPGRNVAQEMKDLEEIYQNVVSVQEIPIY